MMMMMMMTATGMKRAVRWSGAVVRGSSARWLSGAAGGHDQLIRDTFAAQAKNIEFSQSGEQTFRHTAANEMIISTLHDLLRGSESGLSQEGGARHHRVLEAGAGTAVLGRMLAHAAGEDAYVTCCDLTPEMLRLGREAAEQDATLQARMEFVEGSVYDLPFAQDAFDLVFTRWLLHHLEDSRSAMQSFAKVCAPSGHVAIVDVRAPNPDDVDECRRFDDFERLRDASHVSFPTPAQIRDWGSAANLEVVAQIEQAQPRRVGPWFDLANTPEENRRDVLCAIHAELTGTGPSTGMQPSLDSSESAVSLPKDATDETLRQLHDSAQFIHESVIYILK